MKEMNVYNFAMNLAFAKEIKVNLWVHDNETENETLNSFTVENYVPMFHGELNLEEFEVMMCKANKKNCFEIYGYKEIN